MYISLLLLLLIRQVRAATSTECSTSGANTTEI